MADNKPGLEEVRKVSNRLQGPIDFNGQEAQRMLPWRMTSEERLALTDVPDGLHVYETDTGKEYLYSSAAPDGAFPVGSIFLSVVSTNPAELLGYGTWVAFGTGRMLVGVDTEQTEFDTVEKTGGAKTHTLTTAEMPSHTHAQDPHAHQIRGADAAVAAGSATNRVPFTPSGGGLLGPANYVADTTATNQATGGGGAHNNLPPYITCYMWKRTA